MAKKSKGTDETQPGDIVYTHDDKVKFKVKYDSEVPAAKRHMKEGSVVTIHEKHAETLVAKGYGTIIEYLNDKRDKSMDKTDKAKAPAHKPKP